MCFFSSILDIIETIESDRQLTWSEILFSYRRTTVEDFILSEAIPVLRES